MLSGLPTPKPQAHKPAPSWVGTGEPKASGASKTAKPKRIYTIDDLEI
jgi:hypothetical protein